MNFLSLLAGTVNAQELIKVSICIVIRTQKTRKWACCVHRLFKLFIYTELYPDINHDGGWSHIFRLIMHELFYNPSMSCIKQTNIKGEFGVII